MNQKTVWGLVAAVVVILLALWAWNAQTGDSVDDMATTTTPTTTPATTGTTGTTGAGAQVTAPQPKGTLPDGDYILSAEESTIIWSGSKPKVLGYEDTGTIDLKSGSLKVRNGNIISGDFFVDMQSIAVTKTSNTKVGAEMLENHLKEEDFFSVAKYPNTTFVIKNVTNGVVTGDLTIKNITKTISFPAAITAEGETKLIADAKVTLNRALWDIRYGSGTFFDDLGDNLIADEMKLTLHLVAGK